jgi:hypothetical protein
MFQPFLLCLACKKESQNDNFLLYSHVLQTLEKKNERAKEKLITLEIRVKERKKVIEIKH